MSREILFKAKHKDWRELPKEEWWVEGYYLRISPDDVVFVPFNASRGTKWGWIEIDPETLCQYTGKDDEEDNKIFGHDVISINTYDYDEPAEDYFGEVVYVEVWACWCIQQPGEEKPIPLCECEGSYLTEITIEGNAIDNPELLGGAV